MLEVEYEPPLTQTDFRLREIELTEKRSRIERITKGILISELELAVFIFLTISASLIAAIKFDQVVSTNSLEWDSGSFLTNGAIYAGFSQYHQAIDPTRPPVIPFLLSLLFRITGPIAFDGYILSALFYVLAMIGCFLLAKELMNPFLAALAALSFGLSPFVFEWAGIMISDVEGVAMASIALAILVISAKRNKRLLLVALPLFVLTPLTHYSLGLIIAVGIVYLIAAKKNDWILDHYEFYYGFGLSILAFAIFGGQWIAYPFLNHTTIAILIPKASAVSPFHNSLGPTFYAANFLGILGIGEYGELLSILFVLSLLYMIFKIFRKKAKDVNPIAVAMLAWFVLMFSYYSLGWPFADLRYSVEFVLPVIVLAFYFISLVLERFSFTLGSIVSKRAARIATITLLVLILLALGPIFFQSALYVSQNTTPREASLNAGLQVAVSWLYQRVSTNEKLESNWYTLMWWYAPDYNITTAPLDYQLTSSSSYAAWQSVLSTNGIAYVVYVNPTPQLEQNMPMLDPVFNYTATGAQVVIYSVS